MTSSKGPVGLNNGKRVFRHDEPPDEVVRRLRGCRLPQLPLTDTNCNPVGLERYVRGWVAIYFYRGTMLAGEQSSREDVAFHVGYCHHHDDLLALGVRTVGVSTEPPHVQMSLKTAAGSASQIIAWIDRRS